MNCKDCKYWKRDGSSNSGNCLSDKFEYQGEIISGDEVSYEDADSYGAWIIFGENFGCIHFEKS